MALTNKQQRFVEEYSVDSNATQAAIRAGYSERTAEVQGHQLLNKTLVFAAIQEQRRIVSEAVNITAEDVLKIFAREADAGDKSEPNSARVRAAELLGKSLGMFVERQEHGRPGDFAGLSEAELNSKINAYMSSDTEH